jgi:hypothetical protein
VNCRLIPRRRSLKWSWERKKENSQVAPHPSVHRYTVSKQSGGAVSTGALVHYEQTVRIPSPHPPGHRYTMSKQSGGPATTDALVHYEQTVVRPRRVAAVKRREVLRGAQHVRLAGYHARRHNGLWQRCLAPEPYRSTFLQLNSSIFEVPVDLRGTWDRVSQVGPGETRRRSHLSSAGLRLETETGIRG